MKQLRAEGIERLIATLREDSIHILRLSRDDDALQVALRETLRPIELAENRIAELLEERASA